MTERLLIIGNGMASVRLVETLVRLAPDRFAITVVGAEQVPGYNRVLLSALLADDISGDDLLLRDRAWYSRNDVRLITGDPVVGLDMAGREACLGSGEKIPFEACVLATGSHAIRLPLPGIENRGVITFRNLADVSVMADAAIGKRRVAVIGGGLLGIEAAYGLAKRGADVTLVHVMDRLMERQLDEAAAGLVRASLIRRGVKVLLAKQTIAIKGEGVVTGLAFADGETIEADLIVCAVGVRPNADLAASAGLEVRRGIVVDDGMRTSVPGFYAVGECAEHDGVAYGLVEPAYAQAESLARCLIGEQSAFEGMVLATNLKVSGLPVFSAGIFMGGGDLQSVTLLDRRAATYRKLVFNGSRLVGCVLVGDADDALWYLALIRGEVDITAARRLLIHGRSFAESALNGDLPKAA